MMKKSILLMPLAAMLAASCSNDDNLANDGKGNGNGGDAYVAVSIQLPTTKGTRADKNDVAGNVDFNNGIEAEYNVKDVTILIFDSSDNFEQYYSTENGSLSKLTFQTNNSTTDNITSTATTVPLRVTNSGVKHIVAVLNNNKKFDFSTLAKLEDLTKMLNTSQNNANNASSNFGSYTNTAGDGCFFMTSSPYISGSSLVTYATVTPSTTADAAKTNLGRIYVERILGKVSLKTPSSDNWGNNDWTYTVPTTVHGSESAYAGASVKFENWILDVTNKSSYLLRNVPEAKVTNSGDWTSVANLIGSKQSGSNDMQRIYWAEDPNYDSQANTGGTTATNSVSTGLFNTLAADAVASVNGDLSVPQYCFENTFDINNMRKDRTTRVLFKAKFQPKGIDANVTWFTLGASTTPRSVKDVKKIVEEAIGITGYSLVDKWEEKLTCTSTALPADAFKAKNGSDAISNDSLSAINSAIGALKCYIKGECYYVGRIRHFDDATNGYSAGKEAYTSEDLGRYGIVRNNWYQLTVNTVSQPGTPSIPVPDSSIDDDNNYYIDCDINILSWAVREHGFDF